MTLDTQRMSRTERAASLYIRDQIVKPRSKRGNLVDPEFRGAGLEIQTLTDKYVGISGVARSGKSLAILWRLNQLALQYPGMRGLIIRKTRESLNESALVTFERDVLGEGNPIIPNGQRNSRHSYRYPNGSEIIVRGLLASGKDAKAQVMSSEYDVIYVQEATEISEFDYSQLCTRLSNFRTPDQTIILDCNPDAPSHWIWRHHLSGKLKLLHSYLTDNPKWWKIDPSHKDGGYWTEHGKSVESTLSNLTGVQRERLFEGRWTQATGLVYGDDTWNDGAVDGNVSEKADYIPEIETNPVTGELIDAATVYYGCDDGYAGEIDPLTEEFTPESHPRAILLCQMRADGTVCVFDESYKVKTQAERQIKEVEQMGYGEGDSFRRYAEPFRVVVDKSAVDLIGRFNEKYNATNQKIVNVEEGIKYLRSYLGKDENEVRKVLVHPRCKHLRYEMSSYKRDDKGNVMKEYDHGCLVAGTLISTDNGTKPIELIKKGDVVKTRGGYHAVVASGITDNNASVYSVLLSNGNTLIGTGNHPVWVEGKGFVGIDALRYGDIIEQIPYRRIKCLDEQMTELTLSSSMGLNSEDTLTRKTGATNRTTDLTARTLLAGLEIYTKRFGSLLMEKFQRGMRYITLTATPLTTTSQTCNAFLFMTTRDSTWSSLIVGKKRISNLLSKRLKPLVSGVTRILEGRSGKNSRLSSENLPGRTLNTKVTHALFADRNSSLGLCKTTMQNSVPIIASQNIGGIATLTTSSSFASGAGKHLWQTNTQKAKHAPVSVVRVTALPKRETVYNLTIDGEHEYYANGVLVHNCDALRYLVSVIGSIPRPNFRVLG